MQRAFADRQEQDGFCLRLEAMLRRAEPEAALALVRQGLEAIADQGLPIVDIALATHPKALALNGWDAVAATIAREEAASGNPITALGIDFSAACHVGLEPDENGAAAPHLETNYYDDLSNMIFSTASREDILAGYSDSGSEWAGCFAEIDNALHVEGLSALYGAVLGAEGDRDGDDLAGDAYVLASSASAILLHLAVKRHIAQHGLPKPMAVLVGSNEDYPFFDAPVVSLGEARALMPPAPEPRWEPETPAEFAPDWHAEPAWEEPAGWETDPLPEPDYEHEPEHEPEHELEPELEPALEYAADAPRGAESEPSAAKGLLARLFRR